MEATLVLSAAAASVASGLFLAAGMALLKRRHDSPESQQAVGLFAVWWIGLAVYALGGANQDLLAAVGLAPFGLFLALRYMQMFAMCIGLWGLMYYIAYVLTGRKSFLAPLAAFYAAYYAVLLFLVTRGLPHDVAVEPWRTSLVFSHPVLGAMGVALLLVIPPLVGAVSYLLVLREAPSAAHRARIVIIAASTVVWCASIVLRDGGLVAAVVPAALGLFSAMSISWAYATPSWAAKRVAPS